MSYCEWTSEWLQQSFYIWAVTRIQAYRLHPLNLNRPGVCFEWRGEKIQRKLRWAHHDPSQSTRQFSVPQQSSWQNTGTFRRQFYSIHCRWDAGPRWRYWSPRSVNKSPTLLQDYLLRCSISQSKPHIPTLMCTPLWTLWGEFQAPVVHEEEY